MKLYRKLKRVSYHGYATGLPKDFKKVFPELSQLDSEELADRFEELDIEFYTEKSVPVKPLTRLTLPFALVTFLVMLVGVPINFMITGEWGYSLGNENKVLNWLKALRLQ